MPPREPEKNKFTGFLAHYKDGSVVKEKNHYYSSKLKKECATNWHEIDKSQLVSLELLWGGESKIKISIEEYPAIKPSDWFFSHYEYFDLKNRNVIVISRNIGISKKDHKQIYSVHEETGILKTEIRPL